MSTKSIDTEPIQADLADGDAGSSPPSEATVTTPSSSASADRSSITENERKAPTADAANGSERYGFGTLVAVFVVAVVLAGSLGAGLGANLVKTDGSPLASGAGAGGNNNATPTTAPPTTASPGGGAATSPTTAAHHHNADEQAELQPDKPLDPAAQKLVGEQLVQAREAAAKYPTVKEAKAAGMVLAGGMAPGVGAHYQLMSAETLKGLNPDGTVNASYPGSFIYGGTADDAPIVGLMYMSMTSDVAPEGFAGPNDHWHRHTNLCIRYGNGRIEVPFAVDGDVTKAQCDEVQGRFMERTIWMVHAWVVPGWESPKGVFSHDNPNVHCADGTDVMDERGLFCKNQ
jgi:hypothetical protein